MAALGCHRKAAVDSADPLFIPDGATTTAAEMAREDKQRVSHCAKAQGRAAQQLGD